MFWSFHSLADKANNEHLPKPLFKAEAYMVLFKVMRKSFYQRYFEIIVSLFDFPDGLRVSTEGA